MPSRVIDGDKMHQSDKIAALPGWAQPEYPWMYPLADANGVVELTNLRAVHARAYAIRHKFPFSKFKKLISLFEKVGLLFVWEENGKRYGYWTGAERRGRLPSLSTRERYKPIGIHPPVDQLRTFYKRFGIPEASADGLIVSQSRLNHDEIVTGLGVGVGVGLGVAEGKAEPLPIDQAKIQRVEPSAVEKEARLSLFRNGKAEENGVPRWCMTPLHAELYTGIFRKDIEDRFFDCRKMSFDEQVAECVEEAVTNLASKRTRRFIEAQLDAQEVESAALAKLAAGKQTLGLVPDFDFRCQQTVQAVVRSVVEAALEIITSRRGVPSNESH
jgi:hypothetical protein